MTCKQCGLEKGIDGKRLKGLIWNMQKYNIQSEQTTNVIVNTISGSRHQERSPFPAVDDRLVRKVKSLAKKIGDSSRRNASLILKLKKLVDKDWKMSR